MVMIIALLALCTGLSLASGPYVFLGKFDGKCQDDGLYYRDEKSFIFCANGNSYVQPCAPGTKNADYKGYRSGKKYHYNSFCEINLLTEAYTDQLIGHGVQKPHETKPKNYGNKQKANNRRFYKSSEDVYEEKGNNKGSEYNPPTFHVTPAPYKGTIYNKGYERSKGYGHVPNSYHKGSYEEVKPYEGNNRPSSIPYDYMKHNHYRPGYYDPHASNKGGLPQGHEPQRDYKGSYEPQTDFKGILQHRGNVYESPYDKTPSFSASRYAASHKGSRYEPQPSYRTKTDLKPSYLPKPQPSYEPKGYKPDFQPSYEPKRKPAYEAQSRSHDSRPTYEQPKPQYKPEQRYEERPSYEPRSPNKPKPPYEANPSYEPRPSSDPKASYPDKPSYSPRPAYSPRPSYEHKPPYDPKLSYDNQRGSKPTYPNPQHARPEHERKPTHEPQYKSFSSKGSRSSDLGSPGSYDQRNPQYRAQQRYDSRTEYKAEQRSHQAKPYSPPAHDTRLSYKPNSKPAEHYHPLPHGPNYREREYPYEGYHDNSFERDHYQREKGYSHGYKRHPTYPSPPGENQYDNHLSNVPGYTNMNSYGYVGDKGQYDKGVEYGYKGDRRTNNSYEEDDKSERYDERKSPSGYKYEYPGVYPRVYESKGKHQKESHREGKH